MFRKITSFILAFIMVLSMVPVQAFASETEAVAETVAETMETEPTETESVPETEETTAPAEAATQPTGETAAPTEEGTDPSEETVPEETVAEETVSSSEEREMNGSCGENLSWIFQDGILRISGTGPMENFTEQNPSPWYPLKDEIIAAELGDGITSVGAYAFLDCGGMKSVTIPVSVAAIASNAFASCAQLTDVLYGGSREQWETLTEEDAVNGFLAAVVAFGEEEPAGEEQIPDAGVSEDFLLEVDQITDVEDIPEGFIPIFDEQGLRAIADNMSGKYILMKDIHIEGGHWPGLWGYGDPFSGELEGNGHTVSGLYYKEWSSSKVRFGLFEELDGAIISNLKVVGGYTNTTIGSVSNYVLLGGIAGDATGNIQITNCVSDMEFNSITASAYTVIYTGGIIGRYKGTADSASISDCRNLSDIAAMSASGGIVGYCDLKSSDLTIYNCCNDGNITFSKKVVGNDNSNTAGSFGGIAGYISGSKSQTSIALCVNYGNINVGQAGGGIVGCAYCKPDATIASCANSGKINGRNIGGIAGRASDGAIIQDCLNTGAVTMSNSIDDAGGIAGDGGKFYRCLNTGKVKGDAWGFNSAIVTHPGSSSSTEEEAEASVVDCYWLDDGQTNTLYTMASYNASETPRTIRTRGKLTLEELTKEENFANFDFENVWMMNPVLGHPVPVGVRLPLDLEIEEVGDNRAITLNYSGDTYAFFRSKPGFMYIYTLEGFPNERGTVQSQEDGLIRVHLGHYREHGTFDGKITFTAVSTVDSVNAVELDRPKTFDIRVTVTPLEFSQKWELSLDADGGLSLGPSVGVELKVPALGTFGVEATLASLQGGIGNGTAINVSRSYSGGKNTLEVTSEEADRAKVGVESGIDGTILKADVDIISGGTESETTNTGIYGFRIEDFSPDNALQRNAIGVYLLHEAMKSRPGHLMLQDFLDAQAEKAYKEAKLDVITGTGAAVSSSYDGGIGSIKIGDIVICGFKDAKTTASVSVEQAHYSGGDEKYSTAVATSETFGSLKNPHIDGTLAQDYWGREITVEAQRANGEASLETTSLSAEAHTRDSFTVGTEYTTDYNRYRFTEESLRELTADSAGIRSYFAGDQYAIGDEEIEAVGNILSNGENPVEYSNVEKKQKLNSYSLGFSGDFLVGLELDMTLSYLQESEHSNAGGFVVDDRKLETSRSDNLTEQIGEENFELKKFLSGALDSLGQKAVDFFTQVSGTIRDGVQTLWSRIEGKPGSPVSGSVIMCTPSGGDPWKYSHTLEISDADGQMASTMGRPVVISITDSETGEEIADLSSAPLTLTVRYAAEERTAAGGRGSLPALYRCSDDGKNLEYIGGVCDETEMTVTAEITQPGQYVLAVEWHYGGSQESSGTLTAPKIFIDQDFLLLKVDETVHLTAKAQPAELTRLVSWSMENDDETVASVDEYGAVTGNAAGTAYAVATVKIGKTMLSARCRIDVAATDMEEPEKIRPEGVQLNTTKATTELYSTDYADLEILLKLPQNYTMAEQAEVQDDGVAIDSARFTDDAMAELFSISVLDDRRVQIVPTEEALERAQANAKSVASKYTGTITVTVHGQEYETDKLTLTVKQTKPKVKATVAAFNSFYTGQSQQITVTGGTPTAIYENDAKNTTKTTAIPTWLDLEEGILTLNESAPKKSTSGKAYLLIDTEEWRIPAAVTLSVKNSYKVPGVKLAASSVTVSNLQKAASVELQLLCTSKTDILKNLNITDITAPDGYTVENFNDETGTFTLKAENGFKSGKLTLKVTYGDITKSLTLTVKAQDVKLKLSASKVTLNKDLKDTASVTVSTVTGGYEVTNPVLTFDDTKLDVRYSDGKLTVSLEDGAEYGKTYPVTVSAYEGAPVVKLSVAVAKQTAAVKSTIKASGTLDVIRESTAITVKPTYTNVANVDVDKDAVLKIYTSADKYKEVFAEVQAENGIFVIDNSVISDHTLKYKAQLETAVYADRDPVKSSMISLSVKMGTAKLTVKTSGTTLFGKDRNDRALVWFEAKNAALNEVSKVEIKDAKYQDKFEVIDYGNGQFAIGFRGGVPESLIGKTVTLNLNIFIEGNQTEKANTTAKVKLTIVK